MAARPTRRSPLKPRALAWAVSLVLAGAGSGVRAQTQDAGAAAAAPSFRWTPEVAITETLTDNARLSAPGREEADAITELSASLSLEREGGRIQGFLDYTLAGVLRARSTQADQIRHDLDAAGRAELIEEFAYLDASAAVGRESISPFGPQSVDDTLVNPNRTEVRRWSLSPSLRGRLGSRTAWQARLSYAARDSSEESVSDVVDIRAFLEAGTERGERLGWALRASRDINDYRFGRRTETDSATLTLRAAPSTQLELSATGGAESTDALSLEKRSSRRHGFGLEWRPAPGTRLALEREQRYFGRSHSLILSHQTPRSVWTYSDTRGLGSESGYALGRGGTIYDLFFNQFASVEPDPVRRRALVESYLQANGLDPDALALGGFLTTAQTLERRQSLSVAFSGVNNVVVASVQQGRTELLDPAAGGTGELAQSGVVRQRGVALAFARRLTPISSLHLGFAQQHSRGELDSRSSRLRSYTVDWSRSLGERSSLSIGARHVRFESDSGPYRENAVVAGLSVRF